MSRCHDMHSTMTGTISIQPCVPRGKNPTTWRGGREVLIPQGWDLGLGGTHGNQTQMTPKHLCQGAQHMKRWGQDGQEGDRDPPCLSFPTWPHMGGLQCLIKGEQTMGHRSPRASLSQHDGPSGANPIPEHPPKPPKAPPKPPPAVGAAVAPAPRSCPRSRHGR